MSKNKHYDPDEDTSASDDKPAELLEHPAQQELLQKLDEAEQKANQYWERIVRMQADAENVLRRNEREVSNAHKYALEKFVAELLPIVDSLELCIFNEAKDTDIRPESLIEGVNMTLKMFYAALEKFGVKQVNPISQPFDPEFQQAISVVEDANIQPGTVVAVLQKGYTLNNRLIRPALVTVSKAAE